MQRLLRYGIVGIAVNLLMFGSYLALTLLGIGPKLAMTITYCIGAFFGFMSHRKWTFMHGGSATAAAARFVAAHVCGYLMNFTILYLFVDKLSYAHAWVQAASIMVTATFLFLVFKFWTFRNNALPQ